MRRAAIVVGCVLAGLVAGGIWTLLQSNRYRADARVLVKPANPAVQTLAASSLIESNVAQTLRLGSPPRIAAKTGKGGVLTVSVEAGGRERVRQIDAEAVVILTQRAPRRFPGTSVTVLDPAHVAEQTSPTPARNLLLGGLAGLVVGLVLAAVPQRRPAAPAVDPAVERRLEARVDQVSRRELALGQRAGQLAAREADLERREAVLEEAEAAAPEPEPEPQPEPEPEPEEPEPEPQPEPAPAPPVASAGGWTLHALETLVDARTQAGASAAQREEWSTYLYLLREHAAADGTLPASFDGLVKDVFGPLPPRDG